MAEGLLRRWLTQSGVGASVGSAGLLPGEAPATPDAVAPVARTFTLEELGRLVDLLVGGPPRSAAYAEPSRVRRGVIRRSEHHATDPSTGYTRR